MSLKTRGVEVSHHVVETVHTELFQILVVDSNSSLCGRISFLGEESGELSLDVSSLCLNIGVAELVATAGAGVDIGGELSVSELSDSGRLDSLWRCGILEHLNRDWSLVFMLNLNDRSSADSLLGRRSFRDWGLHRGSCGFHTGGLVVLFNSPGCEVRGRARLVRNIFNGEAIGHNYLKLV
jgi:hypothetical protein